MYKVLADSNQIPYKMIYWREYYLVDFPVERNWRILYWRFCATYVPLSMLRLKQNGGFYIGDFFIETPIANINSPSINHLVRYFRNFKLGQIITMIGFKVTAVVR